MNKSYNIDDYFIETTLHKQYINITVLHKITKKKFTDNITAEKLEIPLDINEIYNIIINALSKKKDYIKITLCSNDNLDMYFNVLINNIYELKFNIIMSYDTDIIEKGIENLNINKTPIIYIRDKKTENILKYKYKRTAKKIDLSDCYIINFDFTLFDNFFQLKKIIIENKFYKFNDNSFILGKRFNEFINNFELYCKNRNIELIIKKINSIKIKKK